ncbi:hypothetical protein Micbo1qcDRAFT_161346, partial [Microdochium bolleyi]
MSSLFIATATSTPFSVHAAPVPPTPLPILGGPSLTRMHPSRRGMMPSAYRRAGEGEEPCRPKSTSYRPAR